MLAERPLLMALAISLAAHLLILAATGRLWTAMPEEIGFPIEASLAPAEFPQPAVAPPLRRSAEPPPRVAASTPPPATPEPVVEPPSPAPTPEPPAVEAPRPAEPAPPAAPSPPPLVEPKIEPKPESKPEPARPARPAVRVLPGRVEIRYAVQYGEAGFTAGEARYLWQSRDGRYSLVSTVEAKGLASLFVSGRIVQVSEGEVNDGGLQPEQYWSQQGERRRDSARFLWGQNQLLLSGDRGSVPLPPQAQDLLSFPFQLAATVREGESDFTLSVSNGRKLQEYRFHIVGPERLELPGRSVETLHLQGGREGSGVLDVWLERNAANLPVRVRTLDHKGKLVTLTAEEIGLR